MTHKQHTVIKAFEVMKSDEFDETIVGIPGLTESFIVLFEQIYEAGYNAASQVKSVTEILRDQTEKK